MMNLALTATTPDAGFSAVLYRLPFAASFAKVAALGFTGIEVHLRDAKTVQAEALIRLAEEHRLGICALGTGQAYGADGLSFAHPDPEIRRQAVDRVKEHIGLAFLLRSRVILGLIRGKRRPDEPRDEVQRRMADACKACADQAELLDVDLVIEPINRYETNLLNTVEETMAFLDGVGSSRIGLLLDTFHMNIEEPSIPASVRKAGRLIKHVHAADSNRWAPGFGHLDFAGLTGALREIGYDGYLSAEVLPFPDPDSAGQRMAEALALPGVAATHHRGHREHRGLTEKP